MAEAKLREIFARNKGYPLSLFYDLTIFHLQQSQSDPGIALSLYHASRNKSDDDTGKCFRYRISCFLFLQKNIAAGFFDQLGVMVCTDDHVLVFIALHDLQKSRYF